MLDDFLQQLVEEGDLDSHGRITLDASKAREKLAESRFSRSSEALLAVIAAALLGGATQVKVGCSRTAWTLECDAAPPAPAQLEHLMRDLFRKDQPALLRELGLAFNSLFPKFCTALEILAGDRRGWFEGGEWKTQPVPVPTPGWELRLQRPSSLSDWWRWFTRHWASATDLQILQARTRWSPSPILFEEKKGQWRSSYELDPPTLPPATLATLYIQSPIPGLGLPDFPGSEGLFCHQRKTRARTSLRCLILPGDPRASQILLVYRGLILARHHLNGQVVCFHGVLNTDSLDLDASRQHVVQNQRLRQRIETGRQWVLEATAAWIYQLDPGKLSEELVAFLREFLNRLNLSSNHQTLLTALEPMPLLLLGDGSSLTLRELRESLVRFPALHTGRQASLHDRPLLHPERNNLKKLSRLLKVPVVDATPWCLAANNKEDVSFEPFERFVVGSETWEATVVLPRHWGDNFLVLNRNGERFWSDHKPLFPVPVSLMITLDGSYDGTLESAQKSILDELRQAILTRVDPWLDQLQQMSPSKSHLEHYAALLCLWMRGQSGKTRRLPPGRLNYALSRPGREGGGLLSLSQLLDSPTLVEDFTPKHPVRLLAEWL
ncbi:hypothetical protein ABS71_04230 [bacterium SCN 62-11]|nr:hypothetical protein [Candidatus Eremiobacteraeota bacterium]ODT75627.1 MAG: hypothetical protein ABS71_04230 [bacterium SCN 62-11]